MKRKFEIVIDCGIDKVWAAFLKPDNKSRWQENFQSYTHQSGDPAKPGSVSKLVFDEGNRKIVITETITERREKEFLAAIYESDFAATLIVNHFSCVDASTTRWSSWCNFRFKGFMKIVSLFVAGKIVERTEADMGRFKLMVESDEADGKV